MSDHKSAQSNKGDTNDIDDWEKEFDDKMGNYTDGLPEMYIKGAKPVTKGFWLRSGMDGELDEQAVKDFIRQKIAQETNKARLEADVRVLDWRIEQWRRGKKYMLNETWQPVFDELCELKAQLTADKEQADAPKPHHHKEG